jgi:peptidoglycan/LPS O-acetylase OafA/YrhL
MSFPLLAIGMIMFGVALVYSKSTYLQTTLNIPTDLLVGIGFSSFCVSIVNLPVLSDKYNFFTKAFCSLSNISYSLYLTHFPIVILFGALFYTSNQLLPNVDGFSHFVSLLALLLLVSIIFWSLFEKNTYKLKTFMTKRLIR